MKLACKYTYKAATHSRNRGFSLIELMVVMAMVALLISYVGPYTVQQVDRIDRRAELLSVQQWVEKRMLWGFISGQQSELLFTGTQIKHQLRKEDKTDEVIAIFVSDHTRYPTQSITISSMGIPNQATFQYLVGEQLRSQAINTQVILDETE